MIRQPRTSQPQGPVGIDWGNPITRGLERALDLKTRSTREIAKGFPITHGTNIVPLKATPTSKGIGLLDISGTNCQIQFQSWTNTTNEASVVVIQKRTTSGGSIDWFDFGGSGSGSHFPFSGQFYTDAFWNTRWMNAIAVPAGQDITVPHVIGMSVKNGSQRALYNGVLWHSATNATGFSLPATLDLNPGAFNGVMIAAFLWSRALSDAEIKSLSDNPWALFQPTNRAIWVPVAAAGGSPYTLTADTANVAIAGTATGLAFNRTIIAEAAALAINGTATGLAFNRVLTADTANLALTGSAATLTYTPIGGPTYTLTADTANTAITGADAGLAFNRKLIADTANLPISGTDAGLARGYTLAADTTALGISGSDAALIAVRKLIADSYALAVAGADATLTYTPLTLPTIGRPASDTSNTGWTASTGSDLYAMLDEVTPSDADYISASSVGAVCKMALGTTAYPGTASQVLKYRASSSTGNSVIVRLKEGATTIRAETQLLTSVDTEYSITLTSGEIAAITSGSLSVELESA